MEENLRNKHLKTPRERYNRWGLKEYFLGTNTRNSFQRRECGLVSNEESEFELERVFLNLSLE